MTTDLWYVIIDTDRKYPRLSPGNKLRRVHRMERHALSIAVKEELEPSLLEVWNALEKKCSLIHAVSVTGLTEEEVKKVVGLIWVQLLEKARREMNERREV